MSVLWQQKTHGVMRRQGQANRMVAWVLFAAVLILTLLAAAYLGLVASNVHNARRVWAMEQELLSVQRENQALGVEVARLSAIPMLQERSVALGYQPAKAVDYIYMGAP